MQQFNKSIYIFLIFTLIALSAFAQNYTIIGKVVNAKTGEPLAFVNIIANNSFRGC